MFLKKSNQTLYYDFQVSNKPTFHSCPASLQAVQPQKEESHSFQGIYEYSVHKQINGGASTWVGMLKNLKSFTVLAKIALFSFLPLRCCLRSD